MKSFLGVRSLVATRTPIAVLRQHRAVHLPHPYSSHRISRTIKPFSSRRWNTSLAIPDSEADPKFGEQPKPREPSYMITFTCKPCTNRSSHMITKHGYHKGTVLIKCPSCENRHVISDHLNIFMDQKSTLEDILARGAGEGADLSKLLKKGKLGMRQGEVISNEGDEGIEFWKDGSQTQHQTSQSP